jgi:hypothetical protein
MIAQRARASTKGKTKLQWGFRQFQCGNPTARFSWCENPLIRAMVENPTTSKISGKPRSGRAALVQPASSSTTWGSRYAAPPAWRDGDAGDGSRCHLADCR